MWSPLELGGDFGARGRVGLGLCPARAAQLQGLGGLGRDRPSAPVQGWAGARCPGHPSVFSMLGVACGTGLPPSPAQVGLVVRDGWDCCSAVCPLPSRDAVLSLLPGRSVPGPTLKGAAQHRTPEGAAWLSGGLVGVGEWAGWGRGLVGREPAPCWHRMWGAAWGIGGMVEGF